MRDVLDFAKPIQLRYNEEDINNILKLVCDICKEKADGKGVKLSVTLSTEPGNIMMDRSYMVRAMINLINNAIDASDKGQDILISVIPEKDFIVIKVKDNGSGMDRETLKIYNWKKEGSCELLFQQNP